MHLNIMGGRNREGLKNRERKILGFWKSDGICFMVKAIIILIPPGNSAVIVLTNSNSDFL